jgi:hypothetical protein
MLSFLSVYKQQLPSLQLLLSTLINSIGLETCSCV